MFAHHVYEDIKACVCESNFLLHDKIMFYNILKIIFGCMEFVEND